MTTTLGAHIPLVYHFAMLQDTQRMEGFREAIELAVKPGDVVLELGGGTGVLSFFAAQKASKVYCVEKIPGNAEAAREFLKGNSNGDRVEVICADAFEYLPPEPVSVVICEMLHVGMIREQQIAVIESFKTRYLERFGGKLPRFIPEGFIQGIQPVSFNFEFSGYRAAVPLFQSPGQLDERCLELGDPAIFQTGQYSAALPMELQWSERMLIKTPGVFNGVRVILKNALAIDAENARGIFWHNQYLILPLVSPVTVNAGERVELSLSYRMGCEIEEFRKSIGVKAIAPAKSLSARIERFSTESVTGQVAAVQVPATPSSKSN